MAGTAVSVHREGLANTSELHHLRTTINLLVDDIEVLRTALETVAAQLDADAGVTDTTYSANAAVATAATVAAYKVNATQ